MSFDFIASKNKNTAKPYARSVLSNSIYCPSFRTTSKKTVPDLTVEIYLFVECYSRRFAENTSYKKCEGDVSHSVALGSCGSSQTATNVHRGGEHR